MADRLEISEEQAQALLLVRAFEEADPQGKVLPLPRRRAATPRAGAEDPTAGAAPTVSARERLVPRALALQESLDHLIAPLSRVRQVTRLAAGALPVVLLGGLALGLSTSALGPARSINLLSVPLLGLIAWNLLLYLVFALVWLLKGRQGDRPRAGLSSLIAPLLTLRALKRVRGFVESQLPEAGSIVGRALSAYLRDWKTLSAPLVSARSRLLFHGGAFAVMVGVLGGMYLRGLIFEYQASWQSTFLDLEGVKRLLGFVLAPALVVRGGTLPELPPEGVPGEAAPWIHLFTLSGTLLVLLPRGALMLVETIRVARLRRRLPVELSGPYFRRLLASGRGSHLKCAILPYSTTVAKRPLEKLQTALLDLFGSRTTLEVHGPVPYGEELPESLGAGEETLAPVVIFSLAQTPELEVHGEFLGALSSLSRDAEPAVVILDEGPYKSRLGDSPHSAERLEERLLAWKRVLAEGFGKWVSMDLAALSGEQIHHRLSEALDEASSQEKAS